VHLVAAEEHRKNFALTTIHSDEGKGREIFLPGVRQHPAQMWHSGGSAFKFRQPGTRFFKHQV